MAGPNGERRRATDHGAGWYPQFRLRLLLISNGWERWGRDLTTFVAILLVFVAVVRSQQAVNRATTASKATRQVVADLATTRRTAVSDSCAVDTQQDDVIRAVLNATIQTRRLREKRGALGPDEMTTRELRKQIDRLMMPLGGLRQTPQEKATRCAIRIARGTPPPRAAALPPVTSPRADG